MARIITAAVLAPVFIYITWFAPVTAFMAMIEIICGICFIEYAGMAAQKGIGVFRLRGLFAALIIPIAFLSASSVVFMVMALVFGSLALSSLTDTKTGVERLIFTMFGIVYVGLAYSAPMLVRTQPDGEKLFLLICCSTWGADIGAYYTGRAVGRTKLAPDISPNKTVEGFVGGIVFSVLSGWLFAHFFFPASAMLMIAGAGLIGGLIGPIGDLVESMMKRHFGVKDSGTILPGHGGFLDRTDALMLTIPFFYVFLALIGGLA